MIQGVPSLPVTACTKHELLALSTMKSVEKQLGKTWTNESAVLRLLQMYADVTPWTGSINGKFFPVRTTRATALTSVGCNDPFPIPEKRKGDEVGVVPTLYVDGIDSCVLDELANSGDSVVFDNLAEEMKAFKEDFTAALNYVLIYGDGQTTKRHVDTSTDPNLYQDAFSPAGWSTDFLRGTGFGLLQILGNQDVRPVYLNKSAEDCPWWRAGIYNGDELSALPSTDPDFWDGKLHLEQLIAWTSRRRRPGSKFVAITDPGTYQKVLNSAYRHQMASDMNPLMNGSNYDPFRTIDTVSIGGIVFVSDEYWPAGSIGVFDMSEIHLRPVNEYWFKNTGWVSAYNAPLRKYLWELAMFAVYTTSRQSHFLVCNFELTDFCEPVSICNTGELAAAIAGTATP